MVKYPNKLLSSLRANEVLIYQAEKGVYNKFLRYFVVPMGLLFITIVLLLCPLTLNLPILYSLAELPPIIFVYWYYFNRFSISVYLTNQRIIIFNKITSHIISYELSEIKSFKVFCTQNCANIEIKDETKSFVITNIKVEKFEEEFKKLLPDFVSQNIKQKGDNLKTLIAIIILIISSTFICLQSFYQNDAKKAENEAYIECVEDKEVQAYMKDVFSKILDNTKILNVSKQEKATAQFYLNSDGSIHGEYLVIESDNGEFNDALFHGLEKSVPFPPLPEKAKGVTPILIRYNILYNEKDGKAWLEIMKGRSVVANVSGELAIPQDKKAINKTN